MNRQNRGYHDNWAGHWRNRTLGWVAAYVNGFLTGYLACQFILNW